MKVARIGLILLIGVALVGCPKPEENKTYNYLNAPAEDAKQLLYNLVGRWYPEEEIKRLDDDTMTPKAWCARPPITITVSLDEMKVQCEKGEVLEAAIARVEKTKKGILRIVMRAKEGATLKEISFEKVESTKAVISGSPCFNGEAMDYARFPKFEMLRRQILGGQRCTQVLGKIIAPPTETDP